MTGRPRPRISRLNTALSIPIADAVTPEPVYARPAASHSAWTVPSSPNGPWSAMKTTGGCAAAASRSSAAAAATGPSAPRDAGSS